MSDIPLDSQPATDRPRVWAWLLGVIAGMCCAALVAAHLPDRVKLLGLFPLIWGAAAGAAMGWWASECRLRPANWIWVVGWCLLAIGETGIVIEAWRIYRTDLQTQFAKDPSAGFVPAAQPAGNSKLTPEEQALRRQFEAEKERVRAVRQRAMSLPKFLERRLKPVGPPSSPWPEFFWAGEVLFGSLIGTWMMRRVTGSAHSAKRLYEYKAERSDVSSPLTKGGQGGSDGPSDSL